MAGYIVIRKMGAEKLVLDNSFDSISLINYKKSEVKTVKIDEILELVRTQGKISHFSKERRKTLCAGM